MKICSRCGKSGKFYGDKSKPDGLHPICAECHKTYKRNLHARDSEARDRALTRSKLYRQNNPERFREGVVNATLKKKYGITLAEYNVLLEEQGGTCAVCGDKPTNQRLHVDHQHDTGLIRGLLCQGCNTSIGKLKENPDLIRALAYYVERHL